MDVSALEQHMDASVQEPLGATVQKYTEKIKSSSENEAEGAAAEHLAKMNSIFSDLLEATAEMPSTRLRQTVEDQLIEHINSQGERVEIMAELGFSNELARKVGEYWEELKEKYEDDPETLNLLADWRLRLVDEKERYNRTLTTLRGRINSRLTNIASNFSEFQMHVQHAEQLGNPSYLGGKRMRNQFLEQVIVQIKDEALSQDPDHTSSYGAMMAQLNEYAAGTREEMQERPVSDFLVALGTQFATASGMIPLENLEAPQAKHVLDGLRHSRDAIIKDVESIRGTIHVINMNRDARYDKLFAAIPENLVKQEEDA